MATTTGILVAHLQMSSSAPVASPHQSLRVALHRGRVQHGYAAVLLANGEPSVPKPGAQVLVWTPADVETAPSPWRSPISDHRHKTPSWVPADRTSVSRRVAHPVTPSGARRMKRFRVVCIEGATVICGNEAVCPRWRGIRTTNAVATYIQ